MSLFSSILLLPSFFFPQSISERVRGGGGGRVGKKRRTISPFSFLLLTCCAVSFCSLVFFVVVCAIYLAYIHFFSSALMKWKGEDLLVWDGGSSWRRRSIRTCIALLLLLLLTTPELKQASCVLSCALLSAWPRRGRTRRKSPLVGKMPALFPLLLVHAASLTDLTLTWLKGKEEEEKNEEKDAQAPH